MSGPILAITDGTTRIDLLSFGTNGINVTDWRPRTPENIGTFRESALTGGRKLAQWRQNNPTETFEHDVTAELEDDVITILQDTRRLLIKGLNYQVNAWQNKPVWIEAKAGNETNTRYALVKFFQSPDDAHPYSEPFVYTNGKSTSDSMALILERGDWLSNRPGTGECVAVSSTIDWPYQFAWVNNDVEASSFWSLIQLSNATIVAGNVSKVTYSTNNGGSWTDVNLTSGNNIYELLQLDTGRVLATGSGSLVFRSDDNGVTWSAGVATSVSQGFCMAQNPTTGTVMLGSTTLAGRSTNRGQSFSAITPVTSTGNVTGMVYSNGSFFASDQINVWRSDDDGLTWSKTRTVGSSGSGSRLLVLDDGSIIAGFHNLNTNGSITFYKYYPANEMWSRFSTYDTTDDIGYSFGKPGYRGDTIYWPVRIPSRTLTTSPTVIRSDDKGVNWVTDKASLLLDATAALIVEDLDVYDIEATSINKKDHTTLTLGRSDDECDNETFFSNKHNIANITHVKVFDASATSYTSAFPISSFPQNLLPSTPATGDILYIGSATSVENAGQFDSVIFDLVAITLTNTYTIVWEYWNGAWVTLTVNDGTSNPTTPSFGLNGVRAVNFNPPSDWTTTAIDSVTAYWIRARLSALTGSITPPKQQNRDIYSLNNNWFEVDDVGGDLSAIARFKFYNKGIDDSNRIICGLRSTFRGDQFSSHINLTDDQLFPGINILPGSESFPSIGTFTSQNSAPTGRYISVVSNATSYTTCATVTFSNTIVSQYYGTFHLYILAYQTNGSSGNVQVRAQITSGTGGITTTTDPVSFIQTTDDFELLDLDSITLPITGVLADGEIGDETSIAIQFKTAGVSRTIKFYSIILIPTDEWAGDFVDKANTSESAIGFDNDAFDRYIDIDSISLPRKMGRSVVRRTDILNSISAIYEFGPNGPVMLQNNQTQRLYVLSAAYGTSNAWIVKPNYVWSVQAYKNQRYLSMRGRR